MASGATIQPISRPLIPKRGWPKRVQGKEAKLCYTERLLMENSNGIVIDLPQATGCAEREHGLAMLGELSAAC